MKSRRWRLAAVLGVMILLFSVGLAEMETASIELEVESLQLAVGRNQKISYTVHTTETSGKAQRARWESSDPAVATVQEGTVRAVAVGEADIQVTVPFADGMESTAVLHVTTYQALQSIAVTERRLTLNVGERSETVVPVLKPENVTYTGILLSSSDETVVAVSPENELMGMKAGKAKVTVMTDEPVPAKQQPKVATIEVTVLQPALDIVVEEDRLEIGRGKTFALSYAVLPEDTSNAKLTWESSDSKIVSVSNGKITGKGAGEATITAKTTDGTELEAHWMISVFEPVTGITLQEKKRTIAVGERQEASEYTIKPEGATYREVAWTSDNEYVATVSETGEITAHHSGTATITVTVLEPAEESAKPKTASYTLTVTPPEIAPYSDDFSIRDGTLLHYSGTSQHVEIPYGVLYIESWAFSSNTAMATIAIPETVRGIGDGAFYGCSSLESVQLPEGIEALPYQTFTDCASLREVSLPSTLKTIDVNAFMGCESLESVNLPEGLTSIGSAAFYHCAELKEITLPSTLEELGDSVFVECAQLESIELPKGITAIPGSLFFNCENLKTVTLGGTVKAVGNSAFCGCHALEGITFRNGLQFIAESAFFGCEALKELELPRTLTSIGDRAFIGCGALTHIELPDGLISIGEEAFMSCSQLQVITIPASVTFAGENALPSYHEYVIRGEAGSFAETLARMYGVTFEATGLQVDGLHAYQSESVLAWMKALGEDMIYLPAEQFGDFLRCGIQEADSGGMIGGFSAYAPNVKQADVKSKLRDLTLSADRLIFAMYDFQENELRDGAYVLPLRMDEIRRVMSEGWLSLSELSIASGMTTEGETSWYWMPVYYSDGTNAAIRNEIYLYAIRVQQGADTELPEEMGVFYPSAGDDRIEEFWVSDQDAVAELFTAMGTEYDFAHPEIREAELRTLTIGDSGGDVSDLQQVLVKTGYMSGSVDGYYGPTTEEAVRAYQKEHQRAETGEAEPRLQVILLERPEEKELLTMWMARLQEKGEVE